MRKDKTNLHFISVFCIILYRFHVIFTDWIYSIKGISKNLPYSLSLAPCALIGEGPDSYRERVRPDKRKVFRDDLKVIGIRRSPRLIYYLAKFEKSST